MHEIAEERIRDLMQTDIDHAKKMVVTIEELLELIGY